MEPLPKDPVIEAYKKDVDRTMVRESLRRTPQQRVDALVEMHIVVDELQRSRRTRPQ
jgi:hypothetical protein